MKKARRFKENGVVLTKNTRWTQRNGKRKNEIRALDYAGV